jgi:molybdopterin synthase catalytic subunit
MIRIQREDFSVDEQLRSLANSRCGAFSLFVGTVKSPVDGHAVAALELEAYESMARKELEAIESEARKRYGLEDVVVIHRIGRLLPGDNIVLIITAAVARAEACDGMRYILEELKGRVPLFKKEHTGAESYWHGDEHGTDTCG